MSLSALHCRRLARAELAVYLLECVVLIIGGILFYSCKYPLIRAEIVDDLLVRAKTESPDEHCHRDLAVFIYTNVKHVVHVILIFEPCASVRDNGGAEKLLAGLVMLHFVIYAGRSDKLRNDNTLCAVYYKGAARRHKGEITEINRRFLYLRGLTVKEPYLYLKRCGIGDVSLLALCDRVIRLVCFDIIADEAEHEIARVIGYARDVLKDLFKSLLKKPFVGILLDLDKVWHFNDLVCVGKAHSLGFSQTHGSGVYHIITPFKLMQNKELQTQRHRIGRGSHIPSEASGKSAAAQKSSAGTALHNCEQTSGSRRTVRRKFTLDFFRGLW